MAETNEPADKAAATRSLAEALKERALLLNEKNTDPLYIAEMVYLISWHWADFELSILTPTFPNEPKPIVILPEVIPDSNELEFVYPILDFGSKLQTSKAADMYSAGQSMCKLHYTIEKMVAIMIERLKSSGISTETEVQVAFGGHELAQRKGFECIINLSYNVVVTNFDPGAWGENYLQVVKRLADKGYGYPPEAPRDIYRKALHSTTTAKKT